MMLIYNHVFICFLCGFLGSVLGAATLTEDDIEVEMVTSTAASVPTPLVLGKGSSGTVYRGTVKADGRRVIIKRAEPQHQADINRECRILPMLDHPLVPKLLGCFTDARGQKCMVQELVDGDTVSRLVRQGYGFPKERVPHYIAQLLDILHYVHQQRIGHYDLHDSNVLIGKDGRVRLIDFGLSRYKQRPIRSARQAGFRNLYFIDPDARQGTKESFGKFGMALDYYGVALVLHTMWMMDGQHSLKDAPPGDPRLLTDDPITASFVQLLINRDHRQRWRDCFENYTTLKQHEFFRRAHVDWDSIERRDERPDLVPTLPTTSQTVVPTPGSNITKTRSSEVSVPVATETRPDEDSYLGIESLFSTGDHNPTPVTPVATPSYGVDHQIIIEIPSIDGIRSAPQVDIKQYEFSDDDDGGDYIEQGNTSAERLFIITALILGVLVAIILLIYIVRIL